MRKANPRWQKSFFLHFFLFSFSERENKGINQWRRAKPVDLFLNIDETTQRLCSLNQGQLYYSSHSIQGQRGADPLLPNFQNKKSQTKVYLQASILHVCVSSRHVCKGLWFKSLQLPTKQLQPACPFFFPAWHCWIRATSCQPAECHLTEIRGEVRKTRLSGNETKTPNYVFSVTAPMQKGCTSAGVHASTTHTLNALIRQRETPVTLIVHRDNKRNSTACMLECISPWKG